MAGTKRSGGELSTEHLGKESVGLPWVEEALRGARTDFEEKLRTWIADLTAARTALRHEMRKRKSEQLSEAGGRLERLGEAMRRASDQLVERVRQRAAEFPSANVALLRKVGELEATEMKLAAANAQLRRESDARERLERERMEVERGFREVRERFESAFGNAPIGMALIDMNGSWLQVNNALCRITGYSQGELRATTLQTITHPEDVDRDGQDLRQLLGGQIPTYQVEKRYRHAWGHYLWVLLTVSLVRDDKGDALYLITQAQDISERKELEGRLEYLVDHDFLTGLFNRRRFEQELAQEAQRVARYRVPGAMLLADLDNFKDVNDTFGHKAGDDVLKTVAGMLRQRMRQTDVLARLGGDEFAVFLPQTDAEHAEVVADEIVKSLGRQTAVLTDHSIRITASVGVAMLDGISDVEAFAYADLAMYEAKEAGRNRFAMYRPVKGKQPRVSTRLTEAVRIRRALEEDRILLYCQPILDLKNSEVCQHELLVRIDDQEGGEPLPPSSFLYVAERFGLIQAIDGWVVRKAVALIAEHARAGRTLVLHVNLSGKSIGDPKFAALTEKTLAEGGIDPACVVFELTETAAIANIEEARSFTTRLRSLGCRFALDDFGAGFGSFYYLKNFPFEYLKIDGQFIRGLAASPMDQLLVQAIVGIARGMGKKTVAEFVADEAVARLLCEMGVDCAQGYYIGRPQPVDEALRTGRSGSAAGL